MGRSEEGEVMTLWSTNPRRRRVAYIDAFSGVAGDMLLAAVLDAGCPQEELESGLRSLGAIAGKLLCVREYGTQHDTVRAQESGS